jgi:hypothetical protein
MAVVKNLDAITALYTVLKAALAPIPVFDSFVLSDQYMPLVVLVGNDDDPDSITTGTYDQQFTDLALADRQEFPGAIFGVIVAQSGGADMAGLRVIVRDTANAIDAALRANPTLSGVVDRAWYGLSGESKADPAGGINVRLTFTINYEAAV